jgi:hypothetical protein
MDAKSAALRQITRSSRAFNTLIGSKRGYSKHGLVRLRAAVRELGPRVLDRRTTLGKQLAAWRADLVRDLGGDVSTQQAAIVDLAVTNDSAADPRRLPERPVRSRPW